MTGAGFTLLEPQPERTEPGIWIARVEIGGEELIVPVDLIVPAGAAAAGGRRGARLGAHGKRAARRAVGLEAALIDRDPVTISALEAGDRRSFEVGVVGRRGAQGIVMAARSFRLAIPADEIVALTMAYSGGYEARSKTPADAYASSKWFAARWRTITTRRARDPPRRLLLRRSLDRIHSGLVRWSTRRMAQGSPVTKITHRLGGGEDGLGDVAQTVQS